MSDVRSQRGRQCPGPGAVAPSDRGPQTRASPDAWCYHCMRECVEPEFWRGIVDRLDRGDGGVSGQRDAVVHRDATRRCAGPHVRASQPRVKAFAAMG